MTSDLVTISLLLNVTADKDIIFTVNDGGVTTTMMTMDGSTGLLELPTVGDLRVKGNLTVDGTTHNIQHNNTYNRRQHYRIKQEHISVTLVCLTTQD